MKLYRLCCGLCFCLLYLLVEPSFFHWDHGIKDTDTLDVARGDYLFGSSNVQIQHRNIKSQEKGFCG